MTAWELLDCNGRFVVRFHSPDDRSCLLDDLLDALGADLHPCCEGNEPGELCADCLREAADRAAERAVNTAKEINR